MRLLANCNGSSMVEASIGLIAIVPLGALFTLTLGGLWAKFHLDRQLYESLICIADRPIHLCRSAAMSDLHRQVPLGEIVTWNLHFIGNKAVGRFQWRYDRLLDLKGHLEMNLSEVRR